MLRILTNITAKIVRAIGDAEDAAEKLKFLVSLWCSPFATSLVRSKYVSVGECSPDSMDIEPGGKILLCDTLDFVVADTRKDGLIEAWRKSREDKLARELEDTSKLQGACQDCKYRESCKGGCRARSYLLNGSFFMPDPYCPFA